MTNIDELVEIIRDNGGTASLEEITKGFQKRHPMVILPEHKSIFTNCLQSNDSYVFYNVGEKKWSVKELFNHTHLPYLYVAKNQFFRTISEAMLYCFDKPVPLSQGYFSVNVNEKAWFPQPQNDNWENTLSSDGKLWFEKPKNETTDYKPDNCNRYVFEHTTEGYRFTGLFKPMGIDEKRTRIYEIVDDKVQIMSMRQRVVVCRVTYMKYYDGITTYDTPVFGGSYVAEHNDAYEKNNFHKYEDGYCYGFIETKYKSGHQADDNFAKGITIENINPNCKGKNAVDNVLVILVAFSPKLKKTVVVGWYDNATVFRNRVTDGEKTYMIKCLSQDAFLIPHDDRKFEVPKANKEHFGIGQSNFWYLQKNQEAIGFEQQLLSYIREMHEKIEPIINRTEREQ